MPEKTENDWVNIANDFYRRTQFPNCIGAVDGKHVRIKMPTGSGSLFYNYKHFFSILLLALVDASCCFIAVDVGAVGKSSDSNVFKKPNTGRKLESNQLGTRGSRPLPNDENRKCLPFVIVGDEAFALSEHLLRPYPNRNLSVQQRIYNSVLTRARRMVECAFGILANKWRIFHRPLDVTPQFCDSIVKARCILHNFVRRKMGFSSRILCTKVIMKTFKLQGQEETSKESMWETISPSILRHHTELCLGSTIKYDLESDIPWKSIDVC